MLAPFHEALLHWWAGTRNWLGEDVGGDRLQANNELGYAGCLIGRYKLGRGCSSTEN